MKPKSVCIVTATRAEYGLLKPLILKLKNKKTLEMRLVVTGTHLSDAYGGTWKEIETDGIVIDRKIESLPASGLPQAISACMANTLVMFSSYFAERKPDMLLVLGDRYELLSVCIAAMNEGVPIGHIHGGETTEGAIDECIRHSITKMSFLHFVAAEEYRKRVIQLGEAPERVFMTGALGVENIMLLKKMSLEELEIEMGVSLKKEFALVTFHPVTLELHEMKEQCTALLEAMNQVDDLFYIITMANADAGGDIVNQYMHEFVQTHKNSLLVSSLGSVRYLSLMRECSMVIGNSSSGIIEAPVFKVPTVNIGNRQKGRLQALSILSCQPIKEDICDAIQKVRTEEWKERCRHSVSLYGSAFASDLISDVVEEFLLQDKINLQKKFYDIGW